MLHAPIWIKDGGALFYQGIRKSIILRGVPKIFQNGSRTTKFVGPFI